MSPNKLGVEFFVGPDWSRPTFNHIHDVTPSNPFACQAMRFFSTDHNLLPFHRHRASTPITATSRLRAWDGRRQCEQYRCNWSEYARAQAQASRKQQTAKRKENIKVVLHVTHKARKSCLAAWNMQKCFALCVIACLVASYVVSFSYLAKIKII